MLAYMYDLPLRALFSPVAHMARNILDGPIVEQTNNVPLVYLGQVIQTGG
jgi:hypothetical protein